MPTQFRLLIFGLLLLIISGNLYADDTKATPQHIVDSRIHNLYRLADSLYSGAGPQSDLDFADLKERGIRTLVSVDGAEPLVKLAKQHNLRYVHIPISYAGVAPTQQAALTQVMRECQGPVFVHCHHGKHRGPAAAAICGLATQQLSRNDVLSFMKVAGTGNNYRGLWESVKTFQPSEQIPFSELSESTPPTDLTASMVQIEKLFSQLQKIDLHQTPAQRTELISLLTQEFKESARLRSNDDQLKSWLLKSAQQTQQLPDINAQTLKAVTDNCTRCHTEYRR